MQFVLRAIILILAIFSAISISFAQNRTITNRDYTFDLPNDTWKVVATAQNTSLFQVINGNKSAGYLSIGTYSGMTGKDLPDLVRDQIYEQKQYLPHFVEGKQIKFKGKLGGLFFSYDFIIKGNSMTGLIYYLQAPNKIYMLHFRGLRENLIKIKNQTDSIARSFHVKD